MRHFCIRPVALAAGFGVVNAHWPNQGPNQSRSLRFMEHPKTPKTSDLTIYVTGFGPFMGVEQNPTSMLCDTLKKYVREGLLPDGVHKEVLKEFDESGVALEGFKVLEVAAESCHSAVPEIVDCLRRKKADTHGEAVILHLGVASNRDAISLECRGVNEATFRVPDEKGYQCCGETIVADSAPVMFSSLNLPQILAEMHDRGVKCEMSTDAGRFLCQVTRICESELAPDLPSAEEETPDYVGAFGERIVADRGSSTTAVWDSVI
eukprot:Skav210870  [mRNA]  locus=scaffold7397:6246:9282:+ [translate_table: standard]